MSVVFKTEQPDDVCSRYSRNEQDDTELTLGGQPGRILLVEDSKVNQMVARQLLERRGHTVVVANNGREALAILDDAASAGFGCVLMDVQMPEMGGLECTAVIRDRERGTAFHLPIIALTAHEMEGPCLAWGWMPTCRSPSSGLPSSSSSSNTWSRPDPR